jgi:hypothetical protein
MSATSLFMGAPLTKITGAVVLIAFFSVNSKQGHSLLAFDALRIRDKGEIYRYFSSLLTFSSMGELLPGGMLLVYSLRKFEREMGSRKATVFAIFVQLFTIVLETFLVPYGLYHNANLRYAGPYGLIGALFYLYYRYTPRISPVIFAALGFNFSDKFFHFLWFLQVACANGGSSVLVVALGWLAALVYDKVSILQSLDVPDGVASSIWSIVARVADRTPRAVLPGRVAGATPRAAAPRAPAVTADPASIEQLTLMGFSRPNVVAALQAANNDVQRAADQLLAQH